MPDVKRTIPLVENDVEVSVDAVLQRVQDWLRFGNELVSYTIDMDVPQAVLTIRPPPP